MNYNNELTDDEILELIVKDDINRNTYLTSLLNILSDNGFNRIFSLNGRWGTGKTIFIRKFILLVNYCSIYANGQSRECIYDTFKHDASLASKLNTLTSKPEFEKIKTVSSKNLINAAYFNAWKHDDEEDPIISIIYSLIRQFNLCEDTECVDNSTIDKIISLINIISVGKISINQNVKREDILERVKIKDKIKELIQDVFNSIIEENCEKLILFIDELDRCNPFYAIKLLERIKHYFCDDRLVIVIATNLDELSNTISAVYGERFSSYKYLDKFFDMKLELPSVDKEKFINTFDLDINKDKNAYFSILVSDIIEYNNLEMRETSRYLSLIKHFENKIFSGASKGFHRQYTLNDYLFIPYIIGLYVADINKYNRFLDGNGRNDLISFAKNNDIVIELCKTMFYPSKSRSSAELNKEVIVEDLSKFYDYIYGKNIIKTSQYENLTIGEMEIRKYDINKLTNSISLLEDIKYFH